MRFLQEETATTVSEYAIMIALIIVVALMAITHLSKKDIAIFKKITTSTHTTLV
jgi:Flp pilus assembly pilin Flp